MDGGRGRLAARLLGGIPGRRRLGRRTRLPEKQREALWAVFGRVRAALRERGLITQADLYSRLAARLAEGATPPYDFVVVDEAQDVSVAQLRFVAALGAGRPDALFFAGDLGQRIFQLPFSWKSSASTSAADRRRCASTTGRPPDPDPGRSAAGADSDRCRRQ